MKKTVNQILFVLSAVFASVIISHYLGYINMTNSELFTEEKPEKKSRVLFLKERNVKIPTDNSPFCNGLIKEDTLIGSIYTTTRFIKVLRKSIN